MSNMSYCRFQNTDLALQDCYEHIEDEDLSKEEYEARKRLIRRCVNIALENGWEIGMECVKGNNFKE